MFKQVSEGCWNVYITSELYRDRTVTLCSLGYEQKYVYYLYPNNKSISNKEEEILAYRNSLLEHEETILSNMQKYGESFIFRSEGNLTCPKIEDFETLENDLKLCNKDKEVYFNIANLTSRQNLNIADQNDNSRNTIKWIIIIIGIIMIIVAIAYIIKITGILEAVNL